LKITSQDFVTLFIKAIDLKPFVTGGFQPKLSQGNLNRIPLAIPPFEEQKQIVSKVNQLMAWCDELEKKIEKRDAYQERIMQAVVKKAM
jgi:type I restriction enzyme S subunit